MELKHDDDVRKIFFIFLEFCNKGTIKFNATFGRFTNEIFVPLHKPRKPRSVDEIFAPMRDRYV